MYKRRMRIFLCVAAVVFTVLIVKLAYLQIGMGAELRRQYEQSVRSVRPLPAMRGQIMDRHGRILAADKPAKDLCLEYRFITADPRWIRYQQRLIRRAEGISSEDAERVYQRRAENTWRLAGRLARKTGGDLQARVREIVEIVTRCRAGTSVREQFMPHTVVAGLDNVSAMSVETEILRGRTVGAVVRPSHVRFYPYGPLACHIIGLTGQVTPDDVATTSPTGRGYRAGDTIGKSGVEKMCEPLLAGRAGYLVTEHSGDEPIEIERVGAVAGSEVHLTLDARLQQSLTARMRSTGHYGAIVVISVPRGEVLAMVSTPTYDLNEYPSECESLFADEVNLPLLNRAATRTYPPGSTAKLMVALAALSTGRITEGTSFTCYRSLFPSRPRQWRCTGRHGEISLVRAIKKSCNVYFYHVGEILGHKVLGQWFGMFGFQELPGTGLPAERAGMAIPTVEQMRRIYGRGFGRGDARLMAIGQGYVEASPLQVANVTATIARGGKFISPLLALEGGPKRNRRDLPISKAHIRAVQRGMYQVVNERGGTGYKAFRGSGLGVKVCGKSGTAEVPDQRVRGRVVRSGSMAWFTGYAPSDEPKIAFAVVVEYIQSGGGGSVAGPVAVDVVRECKRFGYLE